MELQVTVMHREGLHIRVAAELARLAARHGCRVQVMVGDGSADAASVLSVLKLGVRAGDSVILQADGPNAETALAELSQLLGRKEVNVEDVQ